MSVGNPHFAAMEPGSTPLSSACSPHGESRPRTLGEKNVGHQDRGGQHAAPRAPSGTKSSGRNAQGVPVQWFLAVLSLDWARGLSGEREF